MLVSGLPAVGKSAIVGELAPRLGALALSRDEIREAAPTLARVVDIVSFRLLGRRLPGVQQRATRGLLNEVSGRLRGGRSVIVEAVAEPELRHRLAQLADETAARFVDVECACADQIEYDRRLATRHGRWRGVVTRIAANHERPSDALAIDTSGTPAQSADEILAVMRRG